MKHILRSILVIFFCSFIFTGCLNFLDGSNLKKQIESVIEIANAKEINVEVNLRNTRCGSVTPAGVSKRKKNVPFEMELTVKSGYSFEGAFNLFEKSGGKTTRLKNADEIISFVEKSRYNAGVGNWNYIYEVTLLTDDYDSILINPDISNPSSIEPPKILDVKIDFRYGNEKKIWDYFDVQLYVECDSEPNNLIYTSFIDSWGDFIDGEWMGCMYDADIEDVGNGNYRMSGTVDLRDTWLMDGEEHKLILYVENDGNVRGSYEVEPPFVFQAYSKTKVQVYNAEDTLYYIYAGLNNSDSIVCDEFAKSEDSLLSFANDLKLIVFDIDEDGLGYNKEGKVVELKYGVCQNPDEIETLELTNTISEYSVYDFKCEFEELMPKFEKVHHEHQDWQKLYGHFELEECPDCELTSAQDVWNHHNEYLIQLGSTSDIPQTDLSAFDFDLRVERDFAFFNERHKVYEILEKYRNQAFRNKSIVKLELPENLDKKKDIYIKVSSENGIDNQKYVLFTISAPPMVLGTEINEDRININLQEQNNSDIPRIYSFNPDLKKWVGSNYRNINTNSADYGFYLSSVNNYNYRPDENSLIGRSYNLHTLGIRKYEIGVIDSTIKKFPSDGQIEVQSNGVNSGMHTISLTLDRDIYNQFEAVFITYGVYSKKRICLSEDNVYSFNAETRDFYASNGKYRIDYPMTVFGVKNGVSYETDFIIEASDDRVKDNVSPSVNIEGDWNWDLFDMVVINVTVDFTGNFLTIMGTPFDVGNNLPDMVPVEIVIKKMDGEYIEKISGEGDKTKYLNIPVGHLENGTYAVSMLIKDKEGNVGNFELVKFKNNRESVSDKIKIIKTGENKWTINAEEANAQKYALSYFDVSGNLWKPLETSGNVSAPAEYEKTGFFQLHLNNPDREFKFYNNFKCHYLFHYPEEKVVDRDFQLWRNSIRINTDKPFFIHFIESDTDWGKDVDEWEGHQSYSYSINDNDLYVPYYEDLFNGNNQRFYEDIKGYSSPYTGTEINPCVVDGDYSVTPYVCQIPWDQLDKKYAAAVIIWADNKKSLIPLETSLR